jgi:hypothetical protein
MMVYKKMKKASHGTWLFDALHEFQQMLHLEHGNGIQHREVRISESLFMLNLATRCRYLS